SVYTPLDKTSHAPWPNEPSESVAASQIPDRGGQGLTCRPGPATASPSAAPVLAGRSMRAALAQRRLRARPPAESRSAAASDCPEPSFLAAVSLIRVSRR